MMRKTILITIGLLVLMAIPLSSQAFDQRSGDFRLRFSGSAPWFAKDNVFGPGETKSKDFWVYNYDSNSQPLYFISYGSGSSSGLAEKMTVDIRREGDLIFKKKLSEIRSRARKQETLGQLTANSSQKYTFSITLNRNLGNAWQNQKTGPTTLVLGYGGFGQQPAVTIPIFGDIVGRTATGVGGEVRGEEKELEEPTGIELGEPELGEVEGEKETAISRCGVIDWLVILLIIAVLALIIWRYLRQRQNK
jgi:hypothetical protein